MRDSARLEEYKIMIGFPDGRDEADKEDEEYACRIRLLLNHTKIDKYSLVDAIFYDCSEIPDGIHEKWGIANDAYLIFGITKDGDFVSKWVNRWDLNSDRPIIDGEVQKE